VASSDDAAGLHPVIPVYEIYLLSKGRALSNYTAKARRRPASRAAGERPIPLVSRARETSDRRRQALVNRSNKERRNMGQLTVLGCRKRTFEMWTELPVFTMPQNWRDAVECRLSFIDGDRYRSSDCLC
jgi:hypothetical protein